MSFLDSLKKVHVIGAGGIGVSAVARLLLHEGKTVTGSDVARNETVDELNSAGMAVEVGHIAANLPSDADLVVFSDAVPSDNPERHEARRLGIRELSYFEFLGEFSKDRWTIAVSGTNGKSTTTALLGLMLERGGLEPTVIVGSKVPTFPHKNLRIGRSKFFVVEADEFNAHMLSLSPQMIVLTNIEEDHLDFYRDLAHIRDTFKEYVQKLPPDGQLILNADDHVCFYELAPKVPFVTYAMQNPADYVARHVAVSAGMQSFQIVRMSGGAESAVADCAMRLPGRFNVMNAMAAATAALELGVAPDAIVATLREFTGIWRRFETVGEYRGATLISDYGHHPTAVRGTIEAARGFFAGRRIVLAFQPHHHNRTRKLFNEFVASFDGADVLVLPEVYDVAGREDAMDAHVSSRELVTATEERDAERGIDRQVIYGGTIPETQKILEGLVQDGDIVILMGAGNLYTIAQKMIDGV
jgi:UDP-N-acetylmuramate--alanine ligase